jgi:hypothetical protein
VGGSDSGGGEGAQPAAPARQLLATTAAAVRDNTIVVGGVRMLPVGIRPTLAELQRCMQEHPHLQACHAGKPRSKAPGMVGVLGVEISLLDLYAAFKDEACVIAATKWEEVVSGWIKQGCMSSASTFAGCMPPAAMQVA